MKEASPSSVGVKALIAMSNSRPSSREGAIDDKKWLAQAEAIRSFLESTPESAESISSHARDTVLQQLQRGDAHVEARGKCWQHVAIELSNLPEWQQLCDAAIQCEPPPTPTPMEVHGASPRQSGLISPPPPGAGEAADVPALNLEYFGSAEPPPRSKSAQELRTTPKPAVDSPPHSLSARNQADEDRTTNKTPSEAPPSPTREAAPPAQPTTSAAATKPKAKMTMMERQNAWMQAKAAALDAAKAEKEKELNDSLKFKPDIESSKRTYKTTPAASTRPEQPRPVLSNPKPMPAAPAPPPAAASKWTLAKAKVAKVKKAKNTKNAKADNKPGASAPVGAEKLAELLAQDKTATVKTTSNPAVEEVEGEEGPEKAREEEEAPLEEEEEEEVAPEEPFVPGSFWWRVEDGRGHYRVNDGSLFQMWTIYRRKDKSRDVDGVAMTVGRLEKPPYDEQVIQMLFDVTKWTEEQAYKWWQENSYRYVGVADENGKLVVGLKPSALQKSSTGWKKAALSETERARIDAEDEASAKAACAKLRKPFDALDPNFTGDTAV